MIAVTESQRRDCIVRLAEDCELAVLRADRVRTGTLRERYAAIAEHERDAALYSAAAFTWATAEVSV